MTTTVLENELYNVLNTNIDFNPSFVLKPVNDMTDEEMKTCTTCFALAVDELVGKLWNLVDSNEDCSIVTLAKEHIRVTFNLENYTYTIEDSKAIVKGVDLN
jgi:hypothetical protein